MFLAHLPAGYIISRLYTKKSYNKLYMYSGLLGSIFPDIDMLYFYLIDKEQTLHHDYWSHVPFWWLILFFAILPFLIVKNNNKYWNIGLLFFINIFVHLFLDTIVGKINWLYPFTSESIYFFNVPVHYEWWVYNFIFHWTFFFEILIIIFTLILFLKDKINSIQK